MKICTAQISPVKGDIDKNIEKHKRLILLAVSDGADMIFFPELSLTGYEPKLSRDLATSREDKRFEDFQKISDTQRITIATGIPTLSGKGVHISMIIFQPESPRQIYSKQHLHSDEFPYFVNGQGQVILEINGTKIAPAICYESLLAGHSESAVKGGAEIYVASVAKSAGGVSKAFKHYPEIAKLYSMPVLMSNCIGPCDDFESAGSSAVWNKDGVLIAQLKENCEGILVYDTDTEKVTEWREQENCDSMLAL